MEENLWNLAFVPKKNFGALLLLLRCFYSSFLIVSGKNLSIKSLILLGVELSREMKSSVYVMKHERFHLMFSPC